MQPSQSEQRLSPLLHRAVLPSPLRLVPPRNATWMSRERARAAMSARHPTPTPPTSPQLIKTRLVHRSHRTQEHLAQEPDLQRRTRRQAENSSRFAIPFARRACASSPTSPIAKSRGPMTAQPRDRSLRLELHITWQLENLEDRQPRQALRPRSPLERLRSSASSSASMERASMGTCASSFM